MNVDNFREVYLPELQKHELSTLAKRVVKPDAAAN